MNGPGEPNSPAAPGQDDGEILGGGVAIAPGVAVEAGGIRLQYSRGSGPGGQNVNKVNTKAEAWIKLERIAGLSYAALNRLRELAGSRLTKGDELHLSSDQHRTQEGNRREIFERLRELVIVARKEPRRRRKTRPTAASRKRRLESKRRRGETKAQRRMPE
jgi:ribosome-associated protein